VMDNQYDLLGQEWNERSPWRGTVAIALAFVLLLTTGFLSGALGSYSRGVFFAQLGAALFAQVIVRAVLRRVADDARWRGRLCDERFAVLALPGADGVMEMRETLSSRRGHVVRYHHLPSWNDRPFESAAYDAQLIMIRNECRILNIDVVLILFGANDMKAVGSAVAAVSEIPVRVQLMPIEIKEYLQHGNIGRNGELRVLELPNGPSSLRDRLLKRTFDIIVASAMLALLWPLLLIVAVLIKIDTPGPAFFRQARHGFNSESISVLKFRSMTTFDDSQETFRQAVRNDPRVTRIGRILRRTSIDELPQLFNVLKGEMSIVGPRPHAVAHNDMFTDRIRRLSRRHIVKPGITGWAQVNGLRGETDTLEKMVKRIEYDLHYIDNWSFLFDLKIVFMTIVMKSTYGAY
jgi:Undecaprenyl-phosphate glucose phosphotransferase